MRPEWMKAKGYVHLTPSLFLHTHWKNYKGKIENPSYISKYGFFPLIHSNLLERKYKKIDPEKHEGKDRSHSHKRKDNGKIRRNAKKRPIHYASHFDALIYSYYGHLVNNKYCELLKSDEDLDNSVIAYRKIKISETEDKGKSTIHFAKEVFNEIKARASVKNEVGVLTFDIENFFPSLDHEFLKEKWAELVGVEEFKKHHFNVFKACTQFRYILLDDLRKNEKRNSFVESDLAKTRREKGYKCFFPSIIAFRSAIKEGRLPIYKNPFYRKTDKGKTNVGIPQGLPLSAILANIYLIDFDKKIVETFVKSSNCFYRRYSDDLVIICDADEILKINTKISEMIEEYHLKISSHKTEKFLFKRIPFKNEERLCCAKIKIGKDLKFDSYMTYLGFEFRGFNTTIKSSNLSKYYRRIIGVVKRRAKRARNAKKKDPTLPHAIFYNQIKKLINKPLKYKDSESAEKQATRRINRFVLNDNGTFKLEGVDRIENKKTSNYYGYIKRCAEIFDDEIFLRQIRKRRKITFQAMLRYLKKYQ